MLFRSLAGDDSGADEQLAEILRAAGAEPENLKDQGFYWAKEAPEDARAAVARIATEEITAERWLRAAEAAVREPVVVAYGWRQAAVSPLLGKLWQESGLREAPQQAGLHPDVLRRQGWPEGAQARLVSPRGQWPVRVTPAEVRPEVIAVCGGPALTLACEIRPDGAWTLPGAKVVKS